LVILNKSTDVTFSPGEQDGAWLVEAESGAEIRAVARQAIARGLAGLEWAVDLPGTVGGAVVGNAGAYGGYTGDTLQGVVVFAPEKGESWRPSGELGLGYRTSVFKHETGPAGFPPVILSATFSLQAGDAAALREKATEYSRRRAERQPTGLSAGSIFKRTEQYPAGFLIDNAGLKGRRIGGAMISPEHANFIINLGGATAQDVRQLIDLIRETVQDKFDLMLELEIELLGEW
jgi:UDP-N-acetylmuramate dehydrogenase